MITRSTRRIQPQHWHDELRDAYTDPRALLDDLGLDNAGIALPANNAGFAFRVPRPFVVKMRHGDRSDPLLLQVLPSLRETEQAPGYTNDPVNEINARGRSSLVRKYAGRALIVITGGCAINCRYCFRRHFPYANSVGRQRLEQAIKDISLDSSLSEVILSGGDPLLLDDESMNELVQRLDGIAHLKRLRVHTRLPATIPSRITAQLCQIFAQSRLSVSVVLHVNHANEIDSILIDALRGLQTNGVVLLNQAVLLADINDSVAALCDLSEALFGAGVVPYYLHLLDPVAGAAHFDVSEQRAKDLISALRARLPGYLVPRLAREVGGESSKLIIA